MASVNISTAVPMVFQAQQLAWRHLGQRQPCEDMLKTFVAESTRSACLEGERPLIGMSQIKITVA